MEYSNPFGLPYAAQPSLGPDNPEAHPTHFNHTPSQQQFMDEYFHHGHYNDYHQPHMGQEEFEDCEILTRPRLTKEQVEVLENQFQAHPKPNSNVKRQLASQTNLPLPRVSVRTMRAISSSCADPLLELVPKPQGKGQTDEETGGV